MTNLHILAKTYGQLPSAIIGIPDEWAAYQFNNAVLLAGLHHEVEATKNGRSSTSAPTTSTKTATTATPKDDSQFRDPMELAAFMGGEIRKMKVPESGVW